MTKTMTFWNKDKLSDFFMEPRKLKLHFVNPIQHRFLCKLHIITALPSLDKITF